MAQPTGRLPMTAPKPARSRPLVWRAGSDGEAHAHEMRPGVIRTLCGERIVLHRLAWPPLRRCRVCLAGADPKAVPMGL